MDFLKNCFGEYNNEFTKSLETVGIFDDLADQFLSETELLIRQAIKKSNLEDTIAMLYSDNPSQLLNSINCNTMAEVLCITAERVSLGLEAIAATLSRALNRHSDDVIAEIAALAWQTTSQTDRSSDGL